jgi:hypothetical protein
MFGALPASVLLSVARDSGCYTQLELDLQCPPFYFIDPEYMCDLFAGIQTYSSSGNRFGSICREAHPAWQALREALGRAGLIKVETRWCNGDVVLKPFYLNNFLMLEGDKFYSATASSNKKQLTQNYNEGKIDPNVKNYRSEEDYF